MNDMTRRTWTRTILIIAVTSSISGRMHDYATSTESSADYLRKVMIELRELNVPPSPVPVRSAEPVYFDVDDKDYLAGKRFSNGKRLLRPIAEQQDNSAFQSPILRTSGKKFEPVAVDQTFSETATNGHYYQIPGPVVVPVAQKSTAPEAPALTKSELATMYKNAIGKGSVASLNALANVLRSGLPTVPPNPVEIAPAQPVYSYYFYPLKTFMNDVRHQHDLQASMLQQNVKPETTGMIQETQKQAANPLFMAISGFVGMAVLFMVGVLLLPKIMGDFSSREDDDDFIDLTKTINEAIEKQNCTEHTAHKRIDKRTTLTTRPMSRPSSVVLLTAKPVRQKDIAKRRRKIQRICKMATCKKSHRGITT